MKFLKIKVDEYGRTIETMTNMNAIEVLGALHYEINKTTAVLAGTWQEVKPPEHEITIETMTNTNAIEVLGVLHYELNRITAILVETRQEVKPEQEITEV